MCGNTTTSRSGRSGSKVTSEEGGEFSGHASLVVGDT